MGRAAALSLACADTDTSRKGDEAKEHQLGSVKIGYYEWQNSAAQRCLAGSNDEHEPEDEGDTGVVDEDLPIRACVHCSFSTQIRYLLQCADCHQFACVRCCHRCGHQGGDERNDRLGPCRSQGTRSSRDRSPRRDERQGGDMSSASSASSSRLAPASPHQAGVLGHLFQ